MIINWNRVRRVILNDRVTGYSYQGDPISVGYKPRRTDLDKIRANIPDAKIHGFSKYGFGNLWTVLIESSLFFEDEAENIKTLTWFQATNPNYRQTEKV